MKKQCLVIIIIFLTVFLIPTKNKHIEEYIEKDDDNMSINIKNYTDLGIISSKKPENTHLWIETDTGVLYLVDSVDNTKIYKSIDKGENWSLITTRTFNIVSAQYKRSAGFIYFMESTNNWLGWKSFYLDISDDSITAISSRDGLPEIGNDHFREGDDSIWEFWHSDSGTFYSAKFTEAKTATWQLSPAHGGDNLNTTFTTEAQSKVWWIYEIENKGLFLSSFNLDGDSPAFVQEYDLDYTIYELPTNRSQLGLAYDDTDFLYFTLKKISDGKYYLISYSITNDTLTELGEYNIALMLERNTATGILEKAFHITEDKIYQLEIKQTSQLYLISTIPTDAIWIAITDNFAMNNDGDVFELVSADNLVFNFSINYGYMKIPTAFMTAIDELKVSEGMLITFSDTFTTAGSTSTEVIFEGYVEPFVDQRFQEIILRSPATELLQLKPEGDYSGRTDQIIVSLLGDYAKYVTPGTLSAGTELGQVHFNGDVTLVQILYEFCLIDKFIWNLTPLGALDYNDGTVDSTINIAETDPISQITKRKGPKSINDVIIKGTIAAGDQVQGDGAEDSQDQLANGKKPYSRTISVLNTDALCSTTEDNILSRWGTQATLIDFLHRDTSIGLINSSETITFQNDKIDPNVGSGQFIIKNIQYDAKNQIAIYTISDRIT